MAIIFDEHGQFGFPMPGAVDYHVGTVGRVSKMEHSILCSVCGEPIIMGDLVIYEDWSEHGQMHRKYYHEQHVSPVVREQYARWLSENFPAGAPT